MDTAYRNDNPLAAEPIGKLIKKYSIPTALTLMVNYLYNIVDQIFIGRGVGVIGMAATNVAFPLTTVGMSLALLLGDGCAANMSLMLGRGKQDEADETASQGLGLICLSGLIFAALIYLFAPFLTTFLGASEVTYKASLTYMRITALGLPFLMASAALAAVIRADGSPEYTMRCMITGAVINTVLDPIFIFVLKAGVQGAAIATIIGQTVSGLLCYKYMLRPKTVKIIKSSLIPRISYSLQITKLGVPSFITQIMNAAVQICMNKHMAFYGALTVHGSEMALSVYGMIMKVYQIAHSMFVGVSSATQPINGFNFGAKNYRRVYSTYRMAAGIGLIISACWFAVYQLFPASIAGLFVSDEPVFLEASRKMFRLYMLAFIVYGLHMPTASFFQGIGRPVKALLIPAVRQGLILIPFSIILGSVRGLWGVLLAVPLADIVSFVFSLILVYAEFGKWKENNWI